MMVTQARLKEVVFYNPDTGLFTWLINTARCDRAGKEAGTIHRDGYKVFQVDGLQVSCHRMAWLYVHGEMPPAVIDHSNGDRGDNRISNLRLASYGQNTINSRKFGGVRSSKWKGVSRTSDGRAWVATLARKYLGRFADERDAAEAYMFAALNKYGEFARFQ